MKTANKPWQDEPDSLAPLIEHEKVGEWDVLGGGKKEKRGAKAVQLLRRVGIV